MTRNVTVQLRHEAGRGSALEALVEAAAGILAADSLEGTLGRIAHHLRALLHYDDLTVYEIDEPAALLRPVFAVGDWVDEVLENPIPLGTGVTGWVVEHRETRNVPNVVHEPLSSVVAGTPDEPEAFVCVPLLARERVLGALNVYRTGEDSAFSDEEVMLVERFATMAALAYDSARQRETLREQVKRDGLTGLLNHRACHERLREEFARRAERRGRAARPRPLQGHQRRATATPRAIACWPPRPSGCARSCARAMPSAGSAARSSC